MCLVGYRQLASEYRRLAALLTRTDDKEALELFAIGWDKIANDHEAMLHNRAGRNRPDESKAVTRVPYGSVICSRG